MKKILPFMLVTLLLTACSPNSNNPNSSSSGSDNASDGQPDKTPQQTRDDSTGTTTP
jgi:ABC-type Fe3+-hydroxamate transport system substrate-binding protein